MRDEAAALRGKVGFIFACRVIRRCSENLSRPLPRRVYRGAARRSINHLRSHKERSVLVGRDLCWVVCDAHQCATLRGFLADASRAIFEKSPPGQSFCSFLQQRAWPSVFTADDRHCFRWLLTLWFFFFFSPEFTVMGPNQTSYQLYYFFFFYVFHPIVLKCILFLFPCLMCLCVYVIYKMYHHSFYLWGGFYFVVYIAEYYCIVSILSFSHRELFLGEINSFEHTVGFISLLFFLLNCLNSFVFIEIWDYKHLCPWEREKKKACTKHY